MYEYTYLAALRKYAKFASVIADRADAYAFGAHGIFHEREETTLYIL